MTYIASRIQNTPTLRVLQQGVERQSKQVQSALLAAASKRHVREPPCAPHHTFLCKHCPLCLETHLFRKVRYVRMLVWNPQPGASMPPL